MMVMVLRLETSHGDTNNGDNNEEDDDDSVVMMMEMPMRKTMMANMY